MTGVEPGPDEPIRLKRQARLVLKGVPKTGENPRIEPESESESTAVASPPPTGETPVLATRLTLPVHASAQQQAASVLCFYCSSVNDAGRRFCRQCGEWLQPPPSQPPIDRPDRLTRIRRRWGVRDPYDRALPPGAGLLRTLAAIVVLVVVLAALTALGVDPLGRARDELWQLSGRGRLAGVTASAPWAVDGVRDRGWETTWTATTAHPPAAACSTPAAGPGGTASALAVHFPAARNVRSIGVEAGLSGADPARGTHWRPRVLELRWAGGGCQVVDLRDSPALQQFRVTQGNVTGVRIAVTAAYPPTGAPATGGNLQLDLGELTFWRR